jgi:hypothetical protein
LAGLVDAAVELKDKGTYGYWERVGPARRTIQDAFSPQ